MVFKENIMEVIDNTKNMRLWAKNHTDLAFVPTMGNLHDGHLSLVDLAKEYAKDVVVSIFVNPLQFGENEDLNTYPKTLSEDLQKLKSHGVGAVFTPSHAQIYPTKQEYFIALDPLSKELCGASRSGHFQGVGVVVLKLLNIICPNAIIFGQKDYQQYIIIKRMIEQFFIDTKIILAPIIRAKNGLALSSRNGYLSDEEKLQASKIYKGLVLAKNELLSSKDVALARKTAKDFFVSQGFELEYISIRDLELKELAKVQEKMIILVALRLGNVRLIDNLII